MSPVKATARNVLSLNLGQGEQIDQIKLVTFFFIFLPLLQSTMSSPRHSYSEQAGKNVANPAAMLLCAANFLDYACLNDHASRWESILDPKKEKSLI